MSKEELLQFAKDEFKKIFDDKYDESRVVSCIENLINEKNSLEDAEKALKAIISRTVSKMENFDEYVLQVVKKPSHPSPTASIVSKEDFEKDSSLLGSYIKRIKSGRKEDLKKYLDENFEKIMNLFDFKPVTTDGKKELITQLNDVKEQLFDAPTEVKEAFNNVVQYFDNYIWDAFGKPIKIGSLVKFYYEAPSRPGMYVGKLKSWNPQTLEGTIETRDYDQDEYGIPRSVVVSQRSICR